MQQLVLARQYVLEDKDPTCNRKFNGSTYKVEITTSTFILNSQKRNVYPLLVPHLFLGLSP